MTWRGNEGSSVPGPCSCEACGTTYIAHASGRGRFCSLPCYGEWLSREAEARQVQRFWSKVIVMSPAECWEWTGEKLPSGYGVFVGARRLKVLAHRYSVGLTRTIPDGMVVDHTCYNTSCVNPRHLGVVTPKENVRRSRVVRRRAQTGLCSHGHSLSDAYVTKAGHLRCRTCLRQWDKARRLREGATA